MKMIKAKNIDHYQTPGKVLCHELSDGTTEIAVLSFFTFPPSNSIVHVVVLKDCEPNHAISSQCI